MESIIMPIEKKYGVQQIGFCVILHHTCVNRWLQYSVPPFKRVRPLHLEISQGYCCAKDTSSTVYPN